MESGCCIVAKIRDWYICYAKDDAQHPSPCVGVVLTYGMVGAYRYRTVSHAITAYLPWYSLVERNGPWGPHKVSVWAGAIVTFLCLIIVSMRKSNICA